MNELSQVVSLVKRYEAVLLSFLCSREPGALDPQAQEACRRKSVTFPGASTSRIAIAERRIGRQLPHDYRAFFEWSDGLTIPTADGHISRLVSVEDVACFSTVDEESFSAWAASPSLERFAPLALMPREIQVFRSDLPDLTRLRRSLIVSEVVNTGGVLLCPYDEYGNDCWETWELEPWSGCTRYRSFQAYLCSRLTSALSEYCATGGDCAP
jgi:hypothetical protein